MPAPKKLAKARVQARDFAALKIPRGLTVSPDGKRVAYTLGRCEFEKNRYCANLYVMLTKTGEPRQWTFGEKGDRAPAWSADGTRLAFLRAGGGQDGVYVISQSGGEPEQVFAAPGFFSDVRWAEGDETLIVNFCKEDDDPAAEQATAAGTASNSGEPAVRKITRLSYLSAGGGYLPKATSQLYRLVLKTKEFTPLTRGKTDVDLWTLAPDGETVAYVTNIHRDPDTHPMHAQILLLNVRTGKKRKLPTPLGGKDALAFSPNGKFLVYLGHNNLRDAWGVEPVHPYLVDLATGKWRDLTPGFDRMAGDLTLTDTGIGMNAPSVVWSADSRHIYYQVTDQGDTILIRAGLKSGEPEPIWTSHGAVAAFAGNGGTLVLSHSGFEVFGDFHVCDNTTSAAIRFRKLAGFNEDFAATRTLGKVREVHFNSGDGTRLHGFLITPPDYSPGRKYPVILEIHGGPRLQYGRVFFHEMQYLAAQGFVVFYTNPRGSQGYGEAFAGSTVAAWGTVDYEDIIAAADFLQAQSFVDEKRIGITGGSYGGYMTAFAIGHTNRFRAAVSTRGAVNWATLQSTSSAGWHLRSEFGGYHWENPEYYARMSAINYADQIRTPLLIMGNDADQVCPTEQSAQLFSTVKLLGKCPVEMWRFPEESHGMSRGGRPDRRVIRLEGIAGWFKKWMKGE